MIAMYNCNAPAVAACTQTTMRTLMSAVLLGMMASSCLADVYLHMPRGSNDRVNEQNTNRNNNNRLFDSQNNNKGGYSVGVDADDYNEVRSW